MLNKKVFLYLIFSFFVFCNLEAKAFSCFFGCSATACANSDALTAICMGLCEKGITNCKASSKTFKDKSRTDAIQYIKENREGTILKGLCKKWGHEKEDVNKACKGQD